MKAPGLAGRDGGHAPLVTNGCVESSEHDAIHRIAEYRDQDHDGDDQIDVIEIPARHEKLAEAERNVNHFSGD